MIVSLRGVVASKGRGTVVVETAGVGYEVFVPAEDGGAAVVGKEAYYLVYEHLREDAHTLYGFRDEEARRLFELLIGVNGVGPKVAMAILSASSLGQLQSAIAAGDPNLLKGVPGVGTKTAQRVMLELRGKLDLSDESNEDPTFQALVALGYTQAQAASAVTALPASLTGEQERIKEALKGLSK